MNDTELFVLLVHDRIGRAGCYKPFHLEPLSRYCARPPLNKAYKLLGLYPSDSAALAAMENHTKEVTL